MTSENSRGAFEGGRGIPTDVLVGIDNPADLHAAVSGYIVTSPDGQFFKMALQILLQLLQKIGEAIIDKQSKKANIGGSDSLNADDVLGSKNPKAKQGK